MNAHLVAILSALKNQMEYHPIQYAFREAGKCIPCKHLLHLPANLADIHALMET